MLGEVLCADGELARRKVFARRHVLVELAPHLFGHDDGESHPSGRGGGEGSYAPENRLPCVGRRGPRALTAVEQPSLFHQPGEPGAERVDEDRLAVEIPQHGLGVGGLHRPPRRGPAPPVPLDAGRHLRVGRAAGRDVDHGLPPLPDQPLGNLALARPHTAEDERQHQRAPARPWT